MTNTDRFIEKAKSYLKENNDDLYKVQSRTDFLEGYFDLPEEFLFKSKQREILERELSDLYAIRQYINKGIILL